MCEKRRMSEKGKKNITMEKLHGKPYGNGEIMNCEICGGTSGHCFKYYHIETEDMIPVCLDCLEGNACFMCGYLGEESSNVCIECASEAESIY
jgi:hypothetical protein